MRDFIILNTIWFVVALAMFNWGHSAGGYEGARAHAQYVMTLYEDAPEPVYKHTPFPQNLITSVR